MRVLIVENDTALGDLLCAGLKMDGHEARTVSSGEAALETAGTLRPELMVLDLGALREDGLEVLAQMGERFPATSVLVLTARTGTEEGVRCLELGADDVVRKPFSFYELRARVKALARRRSQLDDRMLRFGDLEMDRTERRVRQAGGEVELTATEFSLLESLLRRGRQVCSRGELLEEVWRSPREGMDRGAGTNIVEVYINYVRKKLNRRLCDGVQALGHTVIRTVRGEGYRLEMVEGAAVGARAALPWMDVEMPRETALLRGKEERMAEGWLAHG
jgi:DNA-binding response OmpR family regulator